jgi:hypothetical protein
MADNEEWELPGKKGKQAMKEAAAAKAAEKERREEIIKSLRDLIQGIYRDDNPVPEMQSLMITSIDSLKGMGENTSMYADYGADRLARLARKKVAANQMAKNKAEVNAYFRARGDDPEEEFRKVKNRSTERMWGKSFVPANSEIYATLAERIRAKRGYSSAAPSANEQFVKSKIPEEILFYKLQSTKDVLGYKHRREGRAAPTNANVYSQIAKEIRKEEANREAANSRAHRQWRASMQQEYPDWYNYGTAAQGGPAPRAQAAPPPPPKNNWKARAAEGAYEEWTPAAAPPLPVKPLYRILGVSANANNATVSAAYKKAALALHPDKTGSNVQFKELQGEWSKIINENSKKINATKRRRYNTSGGKRRSYKRSLTRKNRS